MGIKGTISKMSPALGRLRILLTTVLVLLIPLFIYYTFYVTKQAAYFTNRDFRLLSRVSSQISTKVEGLSVVFKNAGDKFASRKGNAGDPAAAKEAEENLIREMQENLGGSGIQVARDDLQRTSPEPINKNGRRSGVTLEVKQEDSIQWLIFNYLCESGDKAHRVEMRGRVDFNSLIRPQVTSSGADRMAGADEEEGFENILIAQSAGEKRVIFQQDTSRLRLVSLDKLTPAEKSEKPIDFGVSSTLDVRLAGSDYKIFLQPMTLSVSQAGAPDAQGTPWIICGLVPSAQFKRDILSISYTVLILLGYVTALTILSWPFLKLLLIGPKGRLGTADIYFLGFSMLIGLSLLTTLCLYLYSYLALEKKLDGQLKELSGAIKRNFQDETKAALAELEALNKLKEVKSTLAALNQSGAAVAGSEEDSKYSQTGVLTTRKAELRRVGLSEDFGKEYPYFDTAVWIDEQGKQRFKWTVKNRLTPLINVYTRGYFRKLMEGRYRYADGKEFWLEPIRSRTTGRNEVEISQRVPSAPGEPRWVSAFDTRLLSLMQPVLPAGYGYCVIENDGKVLFHSDETHHLGENFFQECDDDHSLHSAVVDRTETALSVNYLGRGHRLFTSPVENFPTWTLVVFRDKHELRTTFLELLTLSSMLFLAYSLVLLFALSVFYLLNLNTNRRRAWLWPTGALTFRYYLSALVLLGLSLVSGAFIVYAHGLGAILPVSLVSFLGIAVYLLNLRYGKPRESWRRVRSTGLWERTDGLRAVLRRNHFAYVLNTLCLLLLVAIVPSVAFFKMAYESEVALFVKYGQVTMANELAERDERVNSQYAGRDDSPEARELVARRLRVDWDVYDNFFFGTQHERVSGGDDHSSRIERPGAFLSFLKTYMPRYSKMSEVKQGLFAEPFADRSRHWEEAGPERVVLDFQGPRPEGRTWPRYHLETKVPPFGMPGPFWWLVAIVAFVPYFLWVHFAVRKTFLLDLHKPASYSFEELAEREAHRNLFIILDAPYTQQKRLGKDRFRLVDLREVAVAPDWVETFNYGALRRGGSRRVVALDHFEFKFDDPAANRQKTRFLENLLLHQHVTFVISTVEPARFTLAQPESSNGNGAAAPAVSAADDHWSGIISSFFRVYAEDSGNRKAFCDEVDEQALHIASRIKESGLPQREVSARLHKLAGLVETLKEECSPKTPLQQVGLSVLGQPDFPTLDREHLINRVMSQAGTYYHEVWGSCSTDERLTLFHLAQDRLLSPNDPEIEPFLRRGLIVRDPDIHLMNESFRRFVKSEKGAQVVSQYEQDAKKGSLWHVLKPPLLVVLMSVIGFLFITQQSLYNSSLAIMTAITTAIPAFFKLLSLLQKDAISYPVEREQAAKD